MTEVVIEMRDITKIFVTEGMETHALQGIDLKIKKGEFISISGPSGCGKSTLLSIMGLLDIPTEGSYKIDGKEVSQLTLTEAAFIRNEKLGFIFQAFNLIDELSILENIALPLHYQISPPTKKIIKDRAMKCLEKVDMQHRANHKPNQLSGGQQQRVAIARALVCNPSLLLVDEPTGNLDSAIGDSVMKMLEKLNKSGTTLCMVTHDTRYSDMASRKLSLLDGEICPVQNRVKEEIEEVLA